MKDQITHPPDNTDHSVAKQKFRITNWSTYNKALINRGSLTFWLDDGAIQAWYESATPSSRGRPQRYSCKHPGKADHSHLEIFLHTDYVPGGD
ncbi:transposase, partial [Klebsiella variicola]|uniref:transposase n=1 Tax=Klebsiella variicola TaxID=244366 RepID=UPI00280B922C